MKIQSKNLDYYGIIAGISQKIKLVEMINSITRSDEQRKVSIGHSVLALILNGSGLALSKPIYLTGNFFKRKPIELLLGQNINPEDLNDDSLDRALDVIYQYGCDKIFYTIAFHAAMIFEIDLKRFHADTTIMQVYGDYANEDLFLTFGYAKHGRFDLKQFLISLIVSADGAIPIFFEALAGNESDNKHFKKLLKMFENMLKDPKLKAFYAIFDCKMYTLDNLKEINRVLFITRVPETITEAQEAKEQFILLDGMEDYDNYKLVEINSNYGGVKQRWIIVHSKEAYERSQKTISAKINKEKIRFEKEYKKINRQNFSCQKDAEHALIELIKRYKFHEIKTIEIKDRLSKSKKITFEFKLELIEQSNTKEKQLRLGGMFLLATNQLDKTMLSASQVLDYYKDQSLIENRFNIFKNASCFASKIYLKRKERIIALAMVMCLSLLIYSLAERQLRHALILTNATIPNQSGKPTQAPTMKWIYQLFEGVALVTIQTQKKVLHEVTNLSSLTLSILKYLGAECMAIYNISSTDRTIHKKP